MLRDEGRASLILLEDAKDSDLWSLKTYLVYNETLFPKQIILNFNFLFCKISIFSEAGEKNARLRGHKKSPALVSTFLFLLSKLIKELQLIKLKLPTEIMCIFLNMFQTRILKSINVYQKSTRNCFT